MEASGAFWIEPTTLTFKSCSLSKVWESSAINAILFSQECISKVHSCEHVNHYKEENFVRRSPPLHALSNKVFNIDFKVVRLDTCNIPPSVRARSSRNSFAHHDWTATVLIKAKILNFFQYGNWLYSCTIREYENNRRYTIVVSGRRPWCKSTATLCRNKMTLMATREIPAEWKSSFI